MALHVQVYDEIILVGSDSLCRAEIRNTINIVSRQARKYGSRVRDLVGRIKSLTYMNPIQEFRVHIYNPHTTPI